MVARIHHTKNGTEYVLQYKSRTDTIELRINRYTLIGGIPNYFRHEWGTYVRGMDFFKGTVLNNRPFSGLCPHPYPPPLSDAEKARIHEFEKIAGVNLLLTPESVQRNLQSLAQGAANALSAFREAARTLQGLDLNPLISFANPPLSNEPPIPQEAPHLRNTEGLTEAAFDAFMKEIDEVLESADSDDDTVRAAPSHHPEISAEVMHSLWKQAREEDSDP